MKKLRIFIVCCAATLAGLASNAAHASKDQAGSSVLDMRELTIVADHSLSVPLSRLARGFANAHGIAVSLWYADAGSMTSAIQDGADADMLITADTDALTTLGNAGQLDVFSSRTIASCPLVIAAYSPTGISAESSTLLLLKRRYGAHETPLHVVSVEGESSVYSRMADLAFAHSELLEGKTVIREKADSVEEAVEQMNKLNALGLLLATDVFSRPDVALVKRLPNSIVPPAKYKAALLASEKRDLALSFLNYLNSPSAQATLIEAGLSPITPQPVRKPAH